MPKAKDPTGAIRAMAAEFPDVVKGTSCTQSSFKTKKGAFLYIGPGAKGQGFKAMFKLDSSHAKAAELADKDPDRFELGSGQWVVARFSAEKPLQKTLWSKWLKESYGLMTQAKATPKKKVAKKVSSKASRKRKAGN